MNFLISGFKESHTVTDNPRRVSPETLFPLRRRKGGKNIVTSSSFSHLLAKTILIYLFIGSLIWLQSFI